MVNLTAVGKFVLCGASKLHDGLVATVVLPEVGQLVGILSQCVLAIFDQLSGILGGVGVVVHSKGYASAQGLDGIL